MRILLAVDVREEDMLNLAKRCNVPREFIEPDALQLTWGYRLPDSVEVRSLQFTTYQRAPDFRVLAGNLVDDIAAAVVEKLGMIRVTIHSEPGISVRANNDDA